jgi:tripartite-type tricarboxylate transporter receptor subunit TctC
MQASSFAAFLAVSVAAMGISPLASRAEPWPERNVRIITPFPAGTGGDISARLYAERLAIRWGKPVIVENRPGADGILAITGFVSARDGHTLLYVNGGPISTNPFTHDKLPYDPNTDLVPISSGADAFVALSTAASLNINSLAEFVQFARSQPGKLNWGATPGALDYLVPGFLKQGGLDMTHVSYREIAPALQDLAEARIHLYASALATQLPLVQSGKIKVLGVTNSERAPLVPDAPTVSEAGFSELGFEAFLGFFGPREISGELRDRISADIRAVGSDSGIAERLRSTALVVRTNTPEDFKQVIRRERDKVAEIGGAMPRKAGQ